MFGSSGYLMVVNLYYEVPLCGYNLLCMMVLQKVPTLCTSNLFACCFSSRLLLHSTSVLHFLVCLQCNEVFPRFSVQFLALRITFVLLQDPVDTRLKLNVHKTLRRRPGRLLNVLYTFNLRPVSTEELPFFYQGWLQLKSFLIKIVLVSDHL